MASVTGALSAPGVGIAFSPATGRFKVAVNGPFQGAAVLVYSTNGGTTWTASPTQGPVTNGPLFAGASGTVTVEITDNTAGVEYAVQAVAPPGGSWTGSASYTFTDVLLATVTVAPGRTLVANGVTFSAGQQPTIDRADADAALARGFILATY